MLLQSGQVSCTRGTLQQGNCRVLTERVLILSRYVTKGLMVETEVMVFKVELILIIVVDLMVVVVFHG